MLLSVRSLRSVIITDAQYYASRISSIKLHILNNFIRNDNLSFTFNNLYSDLIFPREDYYYYKNIIYLFNN